jgi:rod shape-determining protein MreC
MLKRPHYFAIGLVVLLTLMIWNLPGRTAARLKLGLGSVFVPLFGLISSGQQLTSKAADTFVSRGELLRQNDTLRHENQELKIQAIQADELRRENSRLRQLFGWQQQSKWQLKLCRVVLHEPANWWRSVQIDVGLKDGISNNLPVLTPEGFLIGRVNLANLASSQVVLLGDSNCKVSARVENPGHDMGVIGPSGPLETEFVEMSFLSSNANIKPGQDVKTSGEGGLFPKDILIGKVVDTHPAEFGLATVARVKLAANLSSLDEVWVKLK